MGGTTASACGPSDVCARCSGHDVAGLSLLAQPVPQAWPLRLGTPAYSAPVEALLNTLYARPSYAPSGPANVAPWVPVHLQVLILVWAWQAVSEGAPTEDDLGVIGAAMRHTIDEAWVPALSTVPDDVLVGLTGSPQVAARSAAWLTLGSRPPQAALGAPVGSVEPESVASGSRPGR